MIFMLIAAGVIVIALCAHFSTKSYEPLIPEGNTSYYTDFGPDIIEDDWDNMMYGAGTTKLSDGDLPGDPLYHAVHDD